MAHSDVLLRKPAALLLLAVGARAHSEYRSQVPNGEIMAGVRALGHRKPNGGGELNPFGKAFRAASFRWTEALCRADSDGDGESNGMELGDPCCTWSPDAGLPHRSWRISHPGCVPGAEPAADAVCISGLVPPNCSMIGAQADRARGGLHERDLRARSLTGAATFDSFYYSNAFYRRDFKKDWKIEPATLVVLAELLLFSVLSRREDRAERGTTASRAAVAAAAGLATGCRRSLCWSRAFWTGVVRHGVMLGAALLCAPDHMSTSQRFRVGLRGVGITRRCCMAGTLTSSRPSCTSSSTTRPSPRGRSSGPAPSASSATTITQPGSRCTRW
jgi:hypothetical protein